MSFACTIGLVCVLSPEADPCKDLLNLGAHNELLFTSYFLHSHLNDYSSLIPESRNEFCINVAGDFFGK